MEEEELVTSVEVEDVHLGAKGAAETSNVAEVVRREAMRIFIKTKERVKDTDIIYGKQW